MLCKHFDKCGGCQIQNLSYEEQLSLKVNEVIDIFKKEPEEVIPSPKIFYYRNRMDWAVGKNYEVGLKEFGKWWEYVDIYECLLQSKESDYIRNEFRNFIKENGLEPWDNKNHEGLVRYLIVREGKSTKERMIIILLSRLENKELFLEFLERIKDKITSAYIGINPEISDVSYSHEKYLIYGDKYLREKALDNVYYILPNSFFQPNSYTLPIMIKRAIEFLDPKENETIYDLYSGIGTFSIEIAKYSKKVIGIDVEKETEELFYKNSFENGVSNTEFILSKVEDLNEIKADKIVLDPPRGGIHPKVIGLIGNSGAKRVVYVSCNPRTQYRDIKKLKKFGYSLEKYILIDQFPHTFHIESIAVLEKR
ncbi:MAG: 23S rRNA (uracil(1939)-C(5))-methyltransferase RlmD [Candidatus Nanoclepta minutus]|uniref:23S rRNA (Uracil(1939)-C(5))-methyltransferase RlmD n=1 Tax=Candidatus Nanoclepta minutus TaxID=1940235 RepID=A0A397WN31_9ARCH|nr:MAG: 23S rRNA (uracil(1939)-C(5))-methyltransferase RlmD [Candidatus Nanoclepta minutus]